MVRSEERRGGQEGGSRCGCSSDVSSPDLCSRLPRHATLRNFLRPIEFVYVLKAGKPQVSGVYGEIGRAAWRARGGISVWLQFGRVFSRSMLKPPAPCDPAELSAPHRIRIRFEGWQASSIGGLW